MIQQKIKKDLEKAIEKTVKIKVGNIYLQCPENPEHGDYTSNFAMAHFNKSKNIKTPFKLAQKIVKNFPKTNYLEKIKAIKPGFINFYLKNKVFTQNLKKILKQGNKYGSSNIGKQIKVMIEFGQPNTHKLPHIGHFRSYAIGESIARLLEFTGFNVFRANYQGDIGLQVAKCLWGYKKKKIKESRILEKNIQNLQEAYVYGSKMYEQNKQAKKEIDELNTKIYNQNKSIVDLWKKTRKWSLDCYKVMNKRLNTKYHKEYFESEAAKQGKKIVLKNLNKVFKKSKGAIIFPGEKYGLHTRVFVTSDNNPTYEAKDLALMFLKKKDFDYDLSLVSTAVEQIEYFKVVYKAAEMIFPDLAKKFVHIPFGLVSLTGAKLSSRKGTIVSINEVLEKTKESLVGLMKQKKYSQKQIEKIVGALCIGASKYSILKHTPIKNIVFNIKESVVLQGNSGPYLQYTHARACSILKKSGHSEQSEESRGKKQESRDSSGFALRMTKELALLKLLYNFPEVVEKSAQKYSPNLICNYLFELAQLFNNFYESTPVLKAENQKLKKARLALVAANAQVLKNGLNLLGISAPEKM